MITAALIVIALTAAGVFGIAGRNANFLADTLAFVMILAAGTGGLVGIGIAAIVLAFTS